MGLEDRLLIAIYNLDKFCSEYWQLIVGAIIWIMGMLVMVIVANDFDKHMK